MRFHNLGPPAPMSTSNILHGLYCIFDILALLELNPWALQQAKAKCRALDSRAAQYLLCAAARKFASKRCPQVPENRQNPGKRPAQAPQGVMKFAV